jgi:hypothetical protein
MVGTGSTASIPTYPQLREQADRVCTTVLGQGAWNNLQGMAHGAEWPLLNTLNGLGLLCQGCKTNASGDGGAGVGLRSEDEGGREGVCVGGGEGGGGAQVATNTSI